MVGRLHDQTVACVFRVNIDSGNKYFATLVNIKLLSHPGHLQTMTQQVIELKRLIEDFQPREVVIDTNGLITQALYIEIYIENPLNCWKFHLYGQSAAV